MAVRPIGVLILAFAAWLVVASLAPEQGAFAVDAQRRRNSVVILADDLGYGELGCQGNREIPTLSGESSGRPHETLFWRQDGNTAVRVGDWKLLRHGGQANGPWQLYHLARDSGEAHDLADAEPQRREALLRVWNDLNGAMAAAAFR